MSDADRKKWDARYAAVRDETIPPPSPLLVKASQETLPDHGRALDLACGSGRNALYLADLGFRVDAVDVSQEGLERGRQAAVTRAVEVNWLRADLDRGLPVTGPFDLIVMIRYLNLPLLEAAIELLIPGGCLVAEVFLDPGESGERVSGPRNRAFLAAPGALAAACEGLQLVHREEGRVVGTDGRVEALAQIIGRRPATCV